MTPHLSVPACRSRPPESYQGAIRVRPRLLSRRCPPGRRLSCSRPLETLSVFFTAGVSSIAVVDYIHSCFRWRHSSQGYCHEHKTTTCSTSRSITLTHRPVELSNVLQHLFIVLDLRSQSDSGPKKSTSTTTPIGKPPSTPANGNPQIIQHASHPSRHTQPPRSINRIRNQPPSPQLFSDSRHLDTKSHHIRIRFISADQSKLA